MSDNALYELHNQIRRLRAMIWMTGVVAVVVAAGLSVLVWSVVNERLRRQQPEAVTQLVREQVDAVTQSVREQIDRARDQIDRADVVTRDEWNAKLFEWDMRLPQYAGFASDAKSYGQVMTGVGMLLVSWSDIEPYLDGYKITLLVGNPTTATIGDCELVLAYKGNKKTQHVVTPIYPGRWNPVEVIVTPARPDDLNIFAVSITPKSITFR